jgi:hypothetical protein
LFARVYSDIYVAIECQACIDGRCKLARPVHRQFVASAKLSKILKVMELTLVHNMRNVTTICVRVVGNEQIVTQDSNFRKHLHQA